MFITVKDLTSNIDESVRFINEAIESKSNFDAVVF